MSTCMPEWRILLFWCLCYEPYWKVYNVKQLILPLPTLLLQQLKASKGQNLTSNHEPEPPLGNTYMATKPPSISSNILWGLSFGVHSVMRCKTIYLRLRHNYQVHNGCIYTPHDTLLSQRETSASNSTGKPQCGNLACAKSLEKSKKKAWTVAGGADFHYKY